MERFASAVRRAYTAPGQPVPYLNISTAMLGALEAFGFVFMLRPGIYLLTARGYDAAWNTPDGAETIDMVNGEAVL